MSECYAAHGSRGFNLRLGNSLRRLADDVSCALGDNLVALVLGGGYGRGGGGIIRIDGLERPYNDLDLFLVVDSKRRVPHAQLRQIAEEHGADLGIEVDFSRPLTLRGVHGWTSRLMWYDLLRGHVVLSGNPDVFHRHAPDALARHLPPLEATRLLLNRGAGLLWACRVAFGHEKAPDDDFIRRNYFKAALALGDALLIAHGRYDAPFPERHTQLSEVASDRAMATTSLPWENLLPLDDRARLFRLRPDALAFGSVSIPALGELARLWGQVFLHIERLRVGRSWPTLSEYVGWPGVREREQHRLDLLPVNIIRSRATGSWSWRHPRERLYRQLPVLLYLTEHPVDEWPAESARFLRTWRLAG